jgi:hypothetical protein
MKNKQIDLQEFKREMGLDTTYKLQPFDYEKYRLINPELTVAVYERLRKSGAEWKIVAGIEILEFGEWGAVILPAIPHRNLGNFSANNRYYLQYFHVWDDEIKYNDFLNYLGALNL